MQPDRSATPVGGWNAYCAWARQQIAEEVRSVGVGHAKSLGSDPKAGHDNGNR
jgi:hypothetical protein